MSMHDAESSPRASRKPRPSAPSCSAPSSSISASGNWLHLLRWSAPDSVERLMARADEFDLVHTMHALLADDELIGQGEVVTRR
jgi:hypothetical protein